VSAVVIVGGGLAGGAAAAWLAREGAAPLLLERESEPRHKICGEFLSAEAQAHLTALGLDVAALGGAPMSRVRLVSGRRAAEVALPFPALGLTRLRLDDALLEHARAQGAAVDRGVQVRTVTCAGLQTSAGDMAPDLVLLASGKHEVRGAKRDTARSLQGLIGFKQHYRVSAAVRDALSGYIELILFDGGYAGLQLVEGGIANLCLLVRRERFEAVGRRWDDLFEALLAEPHLARRLGDAEAVLERPLTIADVPYGFLHRPSADDQPNLYRLGDQAAVIPSFTGDGMSIALHSGRLAARAVLEGGRPAAYHARLRRDVARPVRLATRLQRALEGFGRHAALTGLSLAPGALGLLAAWTRIPAPALRRAGV